MTEDTMARQNETEIKYTQNWGGKLEKELHTTFRGQDKIYKVSQVYPITLVPGIYHKKKQCGLHRLIRLEYKRIRDVTPAEIYIDIGRDAARSSPDRNFLEIMRAWYSKKSWWDGEYTILQKLTLERIGRSGS